MKVADIRKKFDFIHQQMATETENFPWENKNAYLLWLAQTMEYVRAGTRILALTAGHFPIDRAAISSRFIQHATEEKGHEKLLISDAKALGTFLATVPVLPEAEAFHKSVYYWIYQGRPFVVMGWILFLEGMAIKNGPAAHVRAEKVFGKNAVSFLRVHTHEDPDHVDKAFAALEAFSEQELKEVAHGLELYAALYTGVYKSIIRNAETNELAA